MITKIQKPVTAVIRLHLLTKDTTFKIIILVLILFYFKI